MQTDEFVQRVQEQASVSTGDEALRAIKATLSTLSERITWDERRDLAAQLPEQLKNYILGLGRQEPAYFLLEEFYNRVAARADLRFPEAMEQAQAVITVLQEAATAGQLQAIRSELPDEFEELFTGEPYGPESPSA